MKRIAINPGDHFGSLTIIGEEKRLTGNRYRRILIAECECGEVREIKLDVFRSNQVIHCKKCLKPTPPECRTVVDNSALGSRARWKETPTYKTWQSMKTRCLNPNHEAYDRYAGRNIGICDRWLTFENFLEDMGERPPGKTLERIDNNAGYSPQNCKWATFTEQAQNKRNSRLIEYEGKTQTMSQWADEMGISRSALHNRLNSGWSLEKAFTPTNK